MAFPQCLHGEGPILETINTIATDPYFDGIEIGWIKDDKTRLRAKEILERSNLRVRYGAQPAMVLQKLNLNSLDEEDRRNAVAQLMRLVDEAVEVGADRLAFLSGPDPGDERRPQALQALIRSTKEICIYARQKGIAVTCETFDREVDKKCLVGPSRDASEFALAVREEFPEFGLMYDLSHSALLYEEPASALALLEDSLVHVHVGNCMLDPQSPYHGDSHPRFGFPGSCVDVEDLAGFLRALFQVGFLGAGRAERPWIGLEVMPQGMEEDPELIIAGTKRVWERAWAMS